MIRISVVIFFLFVLLQNPLSIFSSLLPNPSASQKWDFASCDRDWWNDEEYQKAREREGKEIPKENLVDKLKKESPRRIFKRWLKNAKKGIAGAQLEVAKLYEEGKGVRASKRKAYLWYSLASEQGLKEASTHRQALVSKMTQKELKKAKKKLPHWREKYLKK